MRSKAAMLPNVNICCGNRHLSITDCLTARTACLVCFTSTVNGHSKKKKPWKTGASSGRITNLKQSILETFDIYGRGKVVKFMKVNEN